MSVIITKNGRDAQKIDRSKFVDENELQEYLYENPDIIPIYEIDEDIKLLILAREFMTNSGPIDALGIDIKGNIYIVETKLYKNPDKRIVIAQAIDYGASMWAYYKDFSDFITRLDSETNKKFGVSLNQKLSEFFEIEETQVEELYDTMKENLNKGVFKFVVLMDELGTRLKDLIRFINQYSQFDIYAVELEYYRFESHELMIPKLYGTEVKKDLSVPSGSVSARKKWTKELYFEELKNNVSDDGYRLSEKLFNEVNKLGEVTFGTGASRGSYTLKLESKDEGLVTIMHQWTDGRLDALSGYFSEHELSDKYKDKVLHAIDKAEHVVSKNWYRVEVDTDELTEYQINKLINIYKDLKADLSNN